LVRAELQGEHGLTLSDYEALLVVSRAEDGRRKRVELARSLMLTPSGVTHLLHCAPDEIDTRAEILGRLPGVAEGDGSCSPR
jgi:hypothetical protein